MYTWSHPRTRPKQTWFINVHVTEHMHVLGHSPCCDKLAQITSYTNIINCLGFFKLIIENTDLVEITWVKNCICRIKILLIDLSFENRAEGIQNGSRDEALRWFSRSFAQIPRKPCRGSNMPHRRTLPALPYSAIISCRPMLFTFYAERGTHYACIYVILET
jgi:hypothetical protein